MSTGKIVLTGVKPTSQPHLGNYLGAIRPALAFTKNASISKSLFFVADYHALINVHKPEELREYTYDVAATWLACGLNPESTIMYRQSDIPEIFELCWILACFTAKGLMNRAHAYKAKIAENEAAGKTDLDFGVSLGLFSYPVLMAADILMFSTDLVPVGEDQIQHVEIARDVAQKFNRTYGEILKVPEFVVQKDVKLVPGLDGRKMSKSYGNHIPLFCEAKKLRQLVMKIKTDSTAPEEPKDPKNSILLDLYREFASADEVAALEKRYLEGVSWGVVKETLYEAMEKKIGPMREVYVSLMSKKAELDEKLMEGAERARQLARPLMVEMRKATGIGKA